MSQSLNQKHILSCASKVLFLLLQMGVSSVHIQTTTPVVEVFRGESPAVLECDYTVIKDDVILAFNWYRKRFYDQDFQLIVQIPNNRSPVIVDYGLKRTIKVLYNRTASVSVVRLTINPVSCDDEATYQCEVQVYGEKSPNKPLMKLVVFEKPSKPSIAQVPRVLHDNTNANFKCTGYLGKPAGHMTWVMTRKLRGNMKSMELVGVSNSKSSLSHCAPGKGEQNRLQLTVSRNDVHLECRILQPGVNGFQPYEVKTQKALDIRYAVRNINIIVLLNGREYISNKLVSAKYGDELKLRCLSSGNPSPTYKWRYIPTKGYSLGANLLTEGVKYDTLTLDSLTTNHSGSYICVAQNFVKLQEYSKSKVVKLFIRKLSVRETTTFSGLISNRKRVTFPKSVFHYVLVGGIVTSASIFVLFISILSAHCFRRKGTHLPRTTYRGATVTR